MDEMRLSISDKKMQQMRDDRIWKREQENTALYNLKQIHCPCSKCKGCVQCSLAKVKDHLIQYGREPTYKLWKGLGERDSLDEEWEQEFKTHLAAPQDVKLDEGLDVRSMVQNVFQEIDERPQLLENIMKEIVMDAFTVVDDLQDGEDDDSSYKVNEKPLGMFVTSLTRMTTHMN